MPRLQFRKPGLSISEILAWADDFKRRTGRWPRHSDGRILFHEETWRGVDAGLRRGHRGLPGGSSLARLLSEQRGVRNLKGLPPLTVRQIRKWALDHLERTGAWPQLHSGAIHGGTGESWFGIDRALRLGTRRLRGGSSLAGLLAASGLKHNLKQQPPLDAEKILEWADAYYRRHGEWPSCASGRVVESPFDTWSGIDGALRFGRRGLPTGSSLPQFLNKHRKLFQGKSRRPKPIRESDRLRLEDIRGWAEAYWRRRLEWPNRNSGPVEGQPGLTWLAIDSALKQGHRGLEGGSSLAKLLRPKGHDRRQRNLKRPDPKAMTVTG